MRRGRMSQAAARYMDSLRSSERSDANRSGDRRAFYGLMPASISHEGYSAKPMHSYWDDFWALTGYDDAVMIADALGRSDDATQLARSRDEFRDDLYASIRRTVADHGIDYLPGCAELGDFDATSTTIALAPAGRAGRPAAGSAARNVRTLLDAVRQRAATAASPGRTTRRTNGAPFRPSSGSAGAIAPDRRSISSCTTAARPNGTNGPKWSAAMRASHASSATCRTAGWHRTSSARCSISLRTSAKRIIRS